MNFMAARRSTQSLYAVYLERVINIRAVQCYRAAVIDDYAAAHFFSERYHAAHFFSEGYHCGWYGEFKWSLDEPGAFTSLLSKPASLPMQHAWDAAVGAFKRIHQSARQWRADRQRSASGKRRPLRDRSGGMDAY
jgi:hypothetical protein